MLQYQYTDDSYGSLRNDAIKMSVVQRNCILISGTMGRSFGFICKPTS